MSIIDHQSREEGHVINRVLAIFQPTTINNVFINPSLDIHIDTFSNMDFINFSNHIKLCGNAINYRYDISLPELTIQKSIVNNLDPSFIVIIKGIDCIDTKEMDLIRLVEVHNHLDIFLNSIHRYRR